MIIFVSSPKVCCRSSGYFVWTLSERERVWIRKRCEENLWITGVNFLFLLSLQYLDKNSVAGLYMIMWVIQPEYWLLHSFTRTNTEYKCHHDEEHHLTWYFEDLESHLWLIGDVPTCGVPLRHTVRTPRHLVDTHAHCSTCCQTQDLPSTLAYCHRAI